MEVSKSKLEKRDGLFQTFAEELLPGKTMIQFKFKFDNLFGASVVNSFASYGGDKGLWELAVLRFRDKEDDHGSLCYGSPITSDVIGHLTEDDVMALLDSIELMHTLAGQEKF